MKQTQSAMKTITGNLAQLERTELAELAAIVAAMLSLADPEEEKELETAPGEKQAVSRAKGHIEEKMINGYGPYQYLRYWQGKTLKSQYIGKAKDAQAT
jgi:hypothetical protein